MMTAVNLTALEVFDNLSEAASYLIAQTPRDIVQRVS